MAHDKKHTITRFCLGGLVASLIAMPVSLLLQVVWLYICGLVAAGVLFASLLAAVVYDRGVLRKMMFVTWVFGGAIIIVVIVMLGTWRARPATPPKFDAHEAILVMLGAWVAVLPATGLMRLIRLRKGWAIVPWTAIACAWALGCLTLVLQTNTLLQLSIGNRWSVSRWTWAVPTVVGLLISGGAAFILSGVLARFPRLRAVRATETLEGELVVTCPRCATQQSVSSGESWCRECGLHMTIEVEEQRCPKCGYLLVNLTEAKCPECGQALSEQDVLPAGGAAYLILRREGQNNLVSAVRNDPLLGPFLVATAAIVAVAAVFALSVLAIWRTEGGANVAIACGCVAAVSIVATAAAWVYSKRALRWMMVLAWVACLAAVLIMVAWAGAALAEACVPLPAGMDDRAMVPWEPIKTWAGVPALWATVWVATGLFAAVRWRGFIYTIVAGVALAAGWIAVAVWTLLLVCPWSSRAQVFVGDLVESMAAIAIFASPAGVAAWVKNFVNAREARSAGGVAIQLRCPRCGTEQHVESGEQRCPTCRLKLRIAFEDVSEAVSS